MTSLNQKANEFFPGKVVRKDLTKLIKEGQNVPIYVLEYLLGMYAATDDEAQISAGLERVKKILSENYVRPDEAQKVQSRIKEKGTFSIIDKVTAKLDEKKDAYVAEFSNLGLKNVRISADHVTKYQKLLAGGIWCMLDMTYFYDEDDKKLFSPFLIERLSPIQLANVDLVEVIEARKEFTKDEWIDLLLRSSGMEPTNLEKNVKRHLLERMVPLIENNYNLCELGPRGTGKSHIYKEISPNSILISGGQTTVANLFYNMASRSIGLVGLRDVVAFDEVAGMNFKDKDGIQILKDYMNSGSFARGKEEKIATASIVFVGNINQSIDIVLRTSHLFSPFPEAMNNDTAFFDRIHYYLPGREIPKFHAKDFTNEYGFIVDYLAEFFREMRKQTFTDKYTQYFSLGSSLSQRDSVAVKKTFSGIAKLIYPDGNMSKEDVVEVLEYALAGRRRVKEQLKKIGGMEFFDVHFSYVDKENGEEHFVWLPEMGGGKLISEGHTKAGQLYFVGVSDKGKKGVFKVETQMTQGSGKYTHSGLSNNNQAKEATRVAFDYFKANAKHISNSISIKEKDYAVAVQDLQGIGMTDDTTLPVYIAMCSIAMDKQIQEKLVILGGLTIGGTIKKVENLSDMIQVCFDAGAKRVLIPSSSASDLANVPSDLLSKIDPMFYDNAEEAVYKAIGVN